MYHVSYTYLVVLTVNTYANIGFYQSGKFDFFHPNEKGQRSID